MQHIVNKLLNIMKRIEAAQKPLKVNDIVQEHLGMEQVHSQFAPITIPQLIPLQFNTVWVSDPAVVETVEFLSYGSFMPRKIDVPKTELRITTSPFTLDTEAVFISMGLGEYERDKGINSNRQILEGLDGDGLICSLTGKSLVVIITKIESSSMTQLAAIENAAAAAGAKTIVILIPAKLFVTDTMEGLREQGFKKIVGEQRDDESDEISYIMKKKCKKPSNELPEEGVIFIDPEPLSCPRVTEEWSNLMIRDEDGVVHGGATVQIDKATRIASIELFFISDTVRGTGLGKIVMEKIEDYARDMGIYEIRVNTHEYQAPWFYKKMGYELVDTFPEIMDGYDSYNFSKKLATLELLEAEIDVLGHSDDAKSE